MKPIYYVYMAIFAFLMMLLANYSHAQDKASMMLPNGANVILTDEPCDLVNPKTGKVFEGKKARGEYQGQTNPACWLYRNNLIYVLFFKPDRKTIEGLNYYRPDSFRAVVGS